MTTPAKPHNIRPIQQADNAAIASLIRGVFEELDFAKVGTAYADPMLDKLYEHYQAAGTAYFVAEQNGHIVGGAGIGTLAGQDITCELQKMYLNNQARGQGLAKALISHCLETARQLGYQQCYLETMPNMLAAQALYKKMGFEDTDQAMGDTGHHSCPVWMLRKL